MYKQGDILLVPIPYSDMTSMKKRPVLVLSNDLYNKQTEDIIVAAITSNIRGIDFEILIDNESMLEGTLPKVSCIRSDKIYTLSKEIIVKKYGELSETKVQDVKIKLIEILSN
jgi:mRNA interferase MazF